MTRLSIWPFKPSNHQLFEQLVRPHLKQLYKLAYRFTGQKHDAEDLVQDIMLKLYPRLDEMSEIESLSPWLSRILYHHYIDRTRSQKRSPIQSINEDDGLYTSYIDDKPQPSEALELDLTISRLQISVDKLNEDQRILYILHDVEGYSLPEIQQIVDTPVGTLKSRLNRARNNLRESLKKMEPCYDIERVNRSKVKI